MYKKGHISWWKGKHISEETKRKISEARRGQASWNKGKTGIYSEETKRKMSEAQKGKKQSKEAIRKMVGTRRKNGSYICSEERKRKISMLLKGHKTSEETRRKIGDAHRGSKSCRWKGGISKKLLYSIDWTETLRRSIRERDHYTCQLCGKLQGDRAFSCHHIDYDKQNCNPNNLITLCYSCHQKTNFNKNYWINYFNFRF